MQWSQYQLDIFENVSTGTGNTVVEALAGTSKTTSIIEALKYLPPTKSWLLVAFNTRIAKELRARAPTGKHGDIRTLHSLGLKAILKTFKKTVIDEDKTDCIITGLLGSDHGLKNIRYQLGRTVSLCKSKLISSAQAVDNLLDDHEIELESFDRDRFIALTLQTLEQSRSITKTIDFDDMVWFAHVHQLKVPQYDRIFIDEAQDLNPAQIELVLKTVKKIPKKIKKNFEPSRIMAFGDKNQALYGWAGADSGAIDTLITSLQAKILPLSISYRCPQAVIAEAQKLVPAIEAASNAKQGQVTWIQLKELEKQAKPGCFILSRTNAPLIGLALNFLKEKIPCNIQGRDLGLNLLNTIRASKTKTVKEFLTYLDRWSKAEIERLQSRNKEITAILDKVACLESLASDCTSLADLYATIEKLFDDTDDLNRIILSTVHRAKGLEREVVYILNYTFVFGSSQEEKNIKYVAITRCKDSLFFVSSNKDEMELKK